MMNTGKARKRIGNVAQVHHNRRQWVAGRRARLANEFRNVSAHEDFLKGWDLEDMRADMLDLTPAIRLDKAWKI